MSHGIDPPRHCGVKPARPGAGLVMAIPGLSNNLVTIWLQGRWPHRPRGGALGTHGCLAAPRNLPRRQKVGNTAGGLEGGLGCSAAEIFARGQLVRRLTPQRRRIADLAGWFFEARDAPAALAFNVFNVRQTPNGGGEVELSSFFWVWRCDFN